jgi:hypothetical protein
MRTGIGVVLIAFLVTAVPNLGLCASPAHIQAHVTLSGQALGRTLANQDLLLEAWEEGAKIRADLLDSDGVPTRSAIVRKDLGKLYLIEHKGQTFQEMAYPPPPNAIDYSKIPTLSTILRFGLFKNAAVTLQETDNTRLIRNYRCTGYTMDVVEGRNKSNAAIWASTQVSADKLLGLEPEVIVRLAPQAYQRLVRDILASYTEIEGFPIEASVELGAVRLAGGSFRWELLMYDRTRAPLGAYDPPKGYAAE